MITRGYLVYVSQQKKWGHYDSALRDPGSDSQILNKFQKNVVIFYTTLYILIQQK